VIDVFALKARECRIPLQPLTAHSEPMKKNPLLNARVSPEVKGAFRAVARAQDLNEAALLRRLVAMALAGANASPQQPLKDFPPESRKARLYIRVRSDDWMRLQERAQARSLAASTYVAILLRAHLHSLSPIPKAEMQLLRQAIAEVGTVARLLSRLLQSESHDRGGTAATREELSAVLNACCALRESFKAVVKTNAESWERGHV
jgi:hypothetical protein